MMPFIYNQPISTAAFDREYFGDLGEAEYLKSKPKHHLVGRLNLFEKYARQIGS